jgi:2-hydroxy-3-keto-5-methylthiopentenyl-1-phosphate phosphatase
MNPISDLMVLTDFDGTIANFDMAELVLARFAKGEWKIYGEQLERGEIALEECVNRQFSTVSTSRDTIIELLDRTASFRPGFSSLVGYCHSRKIPLIVVSAGLDFVIKHFMELKGWDELEVYAAKATIKKNSIDLTFPRLIEKGSINFKDDIVMHYRNLGKRVAYIGDGLSDYHAIEVADLAFVVKGSKVAGHCRDDGINCHEFKDFDEVVMVLNNFG